MRTIGTSAALVLVLACAGCGKQAAAPAADPPEEVYRKFVAAYLSTDGKAQWAMLSARQRKTSEEGLAQIKSLPDKKLAELAGQLGTTPESIRAAGPEEFTTLVMKSRMKDPAVTAKYRALGPPKVYIQDKRLRVLAKTPDDKFTWTLWLVEEDVKWKVDEEQEEELEVVKPGGD